MNERLSFCSTRPTPTVSAAPLPHLLPQCSLFLSGQLLQFWQVFAAVLSFGSHRHSAVLPVARLGVSKLLAVLSPSSFFSAVLTMLKHRARWPKLTSSESAEQMLHPFAWRPGVLGGTDGSVAAFSCLFPKTFSNLAMLSLLGYIISPRSLLPLGLSTGRLNWWYFDTN